jgi:alkylhydroperoxidase/carboxymuconolactone decarboxylase family protein YurZ
MVALNRGEELKLHLRAATNNGVTIEEIKEVLSHCGLYCGMPPASSAFQAVREVFNEDQSKP